MLFSEIKVLKHFYVLEWNIYKCNRIINKSSHKSRGNIFQKMCFALTFIFSTFLLILAYVCAKMYITRTERKKEREREREKEDRKKERERERERKQERMKEREREIKKYEDEKERKKAKKDEGKKRKKDEDRKTERKKVKGVSHMLSKANQGLKM